MSHPTSLDLWGRRAGLLIGCRIKRQRVLRRLTQAELAKRVGTHRPLVARVERGLSCPTLQTLLEYADALEMPISELMQCVDDAGVPEGVILPVVPLERP